MLASNLRIVLALSYIGLLFWRSRVDGHIPEYWWIVIGVYFISVRLTYWGEEAWERWRMRRVVRSYSMLDPVAKDAALKALWSTSPRYHLGELVKEEGQAEIGDVVERYPFSRSAKVQSISAFWVTSALATIVFAILILLPESLPQVGGWIVWAGAALLAIAAGILRTRMRFLDSVLEVSRFGLTEVDTTGGRRTILWTAPLLLRYRKWPKRFELSVSGRHDMIRLDFDRVGIDRAFRLTLDYGGFPDLSSQGDAA